MTPSDEDLGRHPQLVSLSVSQVLWPLPEHNCAVSGCTTKSNPLKHWQPTLDLWTAAEGEALSLTTFPFLYSGDWHFHLPITGSIYQWLNQLLCFRERSRILPCPLLRAFPYFLTTVYQVTKQSSFEVLASDAEKMTSWIVPSLPSSKLASVVLGIKQPFISPLIWKFLNKEHNICPFKKRQTLQSLKDYQVFSPNCSNS